MLIVLFLTVKSIVRTNIEACPNILQVPENGHLYRCLSETEEERMERVKKWNTRQAAWYIFAHAEERRNERLRKIG